MIVTVRLIRSFEHRNIKHIVYKDIDGSMLVEDFMQFIKTGKKFIGSAIFMLHFWIYVVVWEGALTLNKKKKIHMCMNWLLRLTLSKDSKIVASTPKQE